MIKNKLQFCLIVKHAIIYSKHIEIDFHKHGVPLRYFDCFYYSQFFDRLENHKKDRYNISFGLNLPQQLLRKSETFTCNILVTFCLELVVVDSRICERAFEDFS